MYGGRADQTKNCLRKYCPEVISNSNLCEAQFWCRFRFYSYSTSKQFFWGVGVGSGGGRAGWNSNWISKSSANIKLKSNLLLKSTLNLKTDLRECRVDM